MALRKHRDGGQEEVFMSWLCGGLSGKVAKMLRGLSADHEGLEEGGFLCCMICIPVLCV